MFSKFKLLGGIGICALIMLQSCTCTTAKDSIRLDGSATVYVISEAVAEKYKEDHKSRVSIGISGSGGGFKKLCSNRIDIIGASRAITESERELCHKNNVSYFELPVAHDGIVVVVNIANDWLNEIKVSALKRIFEPEAEGKVVKWSDVDPSWPQRKFEIFAPGISSGTYDYFTEAVVGKAHSSRGDMTTSEDANVLVHGVGSTKDSIGFFSFAYYLENTDKLKALAIIDDTADKNAKAVMPSKESIHSGAYRPLSRVVYLYANKNVSELGKQFLQFYLETSPKIAGDVGFVPLKNEAYEKALATLKGH